VYGVINKSLREMMLGQYGEAAWERVLKRSGVSSDSFLTMCSYDDSVTYQLAHAAAEELNINLSDALKAFGVHWVEHTLATNYETLARAAGGDMLEFLANLNGLHDRISSTFIDYQPPEFEVANHGEDLVSVLYISTREGLTPFVEGLLIGLSRRFNQDIDIVSIEPLPVELGEKTLFTCRLGSPR